MTSTPSRPLAHGELRTTLIAFLCGAIGVVCATSVTYAAPRDSEIAPVKTVKETRSLR